MHSANRRPHEKLKAAKNGFMNGTEMKPDLFEHTKITSRKQLKNVAIFCLLQNSMFTVLWLCVGYYIICSIGSA